LHAAASHQVAKRVIDFSVRRHYQCGLLNSPNELNGTTLAVLRS
jgi:hypothetical protein